MKIQATQLLKNTKTGYVDTYSFWLELEESKQDNKDLYSTTSTFTAAQLVKAMIMTRELVKVN